MTFTHITQEEKIKRWAKELINTNPNEVMKYGWKERDYMLWWIFGWEIILVWAESGNGKSTWCNQIANNVAKQWFRVVKYSLENRLESAAKEELFYTCNRIRRKKMKKSYMRWPFIANEYWEKGKMYDETFKETLREAYNILIESPVIELDKDKNVSIEDLIKLMEEEIERWTKLFIIDHLHYFVFNGEERLDLQIKNVMHILNEIARKHNVAIVLVAHYKNNTWWIRGRCMKPDKSYFKDASSIYQVAHKIIQIVRDEDDDNCDLEVTKFYMTKFRWPIQNLVFTWKFDLDYYEYKFNDWVIWDYIPSSQNNTEDVFSLEI